MSDEWTQPDPLAPSHCVYGQAGERICGYTHPIRPSWCCQGGDIIEPEMST